MGDKLRESISDFDKAIELANDSINISDIYYNRAHTFLRLAISDFEMYLEHAPDSPEKEAVIKAMEQLKNNAS